MSYIFYKKATTAPLVDYLIYLIFDKIKTLNWYKKYHRTFINITTRTRRFLEEDVWTIGF